MSEAPLNPDDPAFLGSRSFNERLSRSEQRRLDEALAVSEPLRSEVENLQAVDHLMRNWGASPVNLDWDRHADLVHALVSSSSESEELQKVDRLLKQWSTRSAAIDPEQFIASVKSRLSAAGRKSTRGAGYRLLFRIGAPLAAAAAIALAVTTVFWWPREKEPVCQVAFGRYRVPNSSLPVLSDVPKEIVAFDREPGPRAVSTATGSAISFATLGAGPVVVGTWEVPPP